MNPVIETVHGVGFVAFLVHVRRGTTMHLMVMAHVAAAMVGAAGWAAQTMQSEAWSRSPIAPLVAPIPTPGQLALQSMGTTQFVHFSMCTFAGCEQNIPPAPASRFAPTATVDPRQWVRVAASWGAKQVCLTARHSGGFALWQSNATDYGVRASPYRNGTADVVRDFVAACRDEGISPCLYFIPSMDGHDAGQPAETYLQTQLEMLRELLTQYGQIDRLWFDYYLIPCREYGSDCPAGVFPRGWANVTALVKELSPGTVMVPGVDGCLVPGRSTGQPAEGGGGQYPNLYYTTAPGTGNPILCNQVLPTTPNATYAVPEGDFTIQNPGDHWFWRADHASLDAAGLFQHYLEVRGRGANFILNVPPDTSGSVPARFASAIAAFGAALNASFADEAAVAHVSGQVQCGPDADALQLVIPAGVTVGALLTTEDIAPTQPQSILNYTIETCRGGLPCVPLAGLHGQTVGSLLIDIVNIVGSVTLHWRCLAGVESNATASLRRFAAHPLHPPAGWPAVPTKFALQTLYSSTYTDMTPCATRDLAALGTAAANRSNCTAYRNKPGANYSYVRDEHCCFNAAGTGLVPLHLLYSADNSDHMVTLAPSYTAPNGQVYAGASTECWAFPPESGQVGAAALDLYWSDDRRDVWSLSSNASRAEALGSGYRYISTIARVPTAC
eukprot:m.424715 g.424715  ORF g.424715 m.424715 type:complete len:671 (-) comp48212_c0_seq1:55-2067(-)